MQSEHFSRSEFACRCGCGLDTVDDELLMLCEIVREIEGGPVTVSSGHRCDSNNRLVGGSANSQHLHGRAADLMVSSPAEVYRILDERFPDRYGIGLYHNRVHVDSRSGPAARWSEV